MAHSDTQEGSNRPLGAISEGAIQKGRSIDAKSTLRDIPPEVLSKFEPWERKMIEIIQNALKSNRIGDDGIGELKNVY